MVKQLVFVSTHIVSVPERHVRVVRCNHHKLMLFLFLAIKNISYRVSYISYMRRALGVMIAIYGSNYILI